MLKRVDLKDEILISLASLNHHKVIDKAGDVERGAVATLARKLPRLAAETPIQTLDRYL